MGFFACMAAPAGLALAGDFDDIGAAVVACDGAHGLIFAAGTAVKAAIGCRHHFIGSDVNLFKGRDFRLLGIDWKCHRKQRPARHAAKEKEGPA